MSDVAVPVWAWVLLGIVLVVSMGIDLVAHRGDHVDTRNRAIMWTVLWVCVALGFNLFVYAWFGTEPAQEFLAAYLLEKSLSVDNLFVFLLVFTALRIPQREQRRVLTWGILGAIFFRGLLIFAGAAAVQRWDAVLYVFGGILLIAAWKVLHEEDETKENVFLTWLTKHLRWTNKIEGHRFFTVENGRRVATPLLLALLAIELTDIVFAIDSVPAAFAVTQEPFIIYSSNLLAILGLRALYVVLAGALAGLRYLRYGLAAVLAFAGLKLIAANWIHLPPLLSVGIIASTITLSVVASLWANRRDRIRSLRDLHDGLHDPQMPETTGPA